MPYLKFVLTDEDILNKPTGDPLKCIISSKLLKEIIIDTDTYFPCTGSACLSILDRTTGNIAIDFGLSKPIGKMYDEFREIHESVLVDRPERIKTRKIRIKIPDKYTELAYKVLKPKYIHNW